RAVQTRNGATQGVEARSRELRRSCEFEAADRGAYVDVIARLKVERPRRAPAAHFNVLRFRLPDRYARVREIRHGEQPVAQACLDVGELTFQRAELAADRTDLGHQRRSVFTSALRGADLFGQRVTAGLQLLRSRLDRLAFRLDALEFFGVEDIAAVAQSQSDAGEILAQQLDVEHARILANDP